MKSKNARNAFCPPVVFSSLLNTHRVFGQPKPWQACDGDIFPLFGLMCEVTQLSLPPIPKCALGKTALQRGQLGFATTVWNIPINHWANKVFWAPGEVGMERRVPGSCAARASAAGVQAVMCRWQRDGGMQRMSRICSRGKEGIVAQDCWVGKQEKSPLKNNMLGSDLWGSWMCWKLGGDLEKAMLGPGLLEKSPGAGSLLICRCLGLQEVPAAKGRWVPSTWTLGISQRSQELQGQPWGTLREGAISNLGEPSLWNPSVWNPTLVILVGWFFVIWLFWEHGRARSSPCMPESSSFSAQLQHSENGNYSKLWLFSW